MARPRLYLGNIPFSATENDIRAFLTPRKITDVKIVTDRETGRPRGFAFAELADSREVETAIRDLDGQTMDGRRIVVSQAKERENRGDRPHQNQGHREDGRRGRRNRGDYDSSWE